MWHLCIYSPTSITSEHLKLKIEYTTHRIVFLIKRKDINEQEHYISYELYLCAPHKVLKYKKNGMEKADTERGSVREGEGGRMKMAMTN